MDAQAFLILYECNIAGTQGSARFHEHLLAAKKIRAHAISVHAKLHTMAAFQQIGAEFAQEPGIPANLQFTRGHGEWPPQRFP
jgi:hypothetical protein